MASIKGKTALVFGAGAEGNIGHGIARRFVQEGANVMIAGRNPAPLAAAAAGLGCSHTVGDITVDADIQRMIAEASRQLGRIDIAVNAAGIQKTALFLDTAREDLERLCLAQFIAPFRLFQALVKAMGSGGSIIQISSATATIMLDGTCAYAGTKAGFDHVVRGAAHECGHLGIRLNSISPGFTRTPATEGAFGNAALLALFEAEYPLGRVGTVEDIADAAVWLGSDGCFLTGQNLQINGGLTLRRNPRRKEIAAARNAAA